jgi:hypothetical protein
MKGRRRADGAVSERNPSGELDSADITCLANEMSRRALSNNCHSRVRDLLDHPWPHVVQQPLDAVDVGGRVHAPCEHHPTLPLRFAPRESLQLDSRRDCFHGLQAIVAFEALRVALGDRDG